MSFAFAMRALRRHIVLIVITTALIAGAGIALGQVVPKTYSSQAQILLGLDIQGSTMDPQSAGLYLKDRAMTYAQLVTADEVIDPVAAAVGLTPAALRAQVVASVVPETVMLNLTATGSSPEAAAALAQSVSDRFQLQLSAMNVRTGGPAILPSQVTSPRPAIAPNQLAGKTLIAVSALVALVVAVALALLVEVIKHNRAARKGKEGSDGPAAATPQPRPVNEQTGVQELPQAVNGTERRLRPPYTAGSANKAVAIANPQRREQPRDRGTRQTFGRHSGDSATVDR